MSRLSLTRNSTHARRNVGVHVLAGPRYSMAAEGTEGVIGGGCASCCVRAKVFRSVEIEKKKKTRILQIEL